MSRKALLVALAVALVVSAALPASAETVYGSDPVGEQMDLVGPILSGDEIDWPAYEPFHVRQGYAYGSELARSWQFHFRLKVDDSGNSRTA